MMISYKVRMREYERLKGRLKWAIRSILGTYRPAVSLEQLVEADLRFLNATPPICEVLDGYEHKADNERNRGAKCPP